MGTKKVFIALVAIESAIKDKSDFNRILLLLMSHFSEILLIIDRLLKAQLWSGLRKN